MEPLPLFPLNSVLFPGIPLVLHIFEDRYKLMIGQCIARRQPFGVVLLESGSAEQRPGQMSIPCSIGCTAVISHVQPLGQGRMSIVVHGKDRFRISQLAYDRPYLVGQVEWLPFATTTDAESGQLGHALRTQTERYLELKSRDGDRDVDPAALPQTALNLAFMSISMLKVTEREKQEVLEAATEPEVLTRALRLLRKEVTFLELLARPVTNENRGAFSAN